MSSRTRQADFALTKQEGNTRSDHHNKTSTSSSSSTKPPPSTTTSSTSAWSRLKDPRIVRVSRAFGGKDRHSKVCTVRGLRDRRVRLSVPTAIQLYDLQDRLGLNQPSKVVDWLLNAAKDEIDELPPLQMPPPGNFPQNLHHLMLQTSYHHHHHHHNNTNNISNVFSWNNNDHHHHQQQPPPKDVARETTTTHHDDDDDDDDDDKDHCNNNDLEDDRDQPGGGSGGSYIGNSPSNFFQRSTHGSLAGLMNNSMSSYTSFLRWDASNLSLSSHGFMPSPPQPDEFRNFNIVQLPSISSSSSSQVVVYPHHHQSYSNYLPSNIITTSGADQFDHDDNKHMINLQNPFSNSLTQPVAVVDHHHHSSGDHAPVRPFHFSMMAANLLPSHNNAETDPNK